MKMYYLKNVFHALYELEKENKIKGFHIEYISYPRDYLIKFGESPKMKRYVIKYTTDFLGKNKYLTFNSDMKIDLKSELLKAIDQNIENLNLY